MSPIPYSRHEQNGPTGDTLVLQCPRCGATLHRDGQALTCEDCGFAPRHGAD